MNNVMEITLALYYMQEHKGRGLINYDVTCKLCGEENEDFGTFHHNVRKSGM